MDYEDLIVEKKDGVATVTLNSPQKMNAVTKKMGAGLICATDELANDDDIRVVLVTGAGRAFCAGADVSGMASRQGKEQIPRRERVAGTASGFGYLRMDKPVIAAVNGIAVGMGFALTMMADIRIAAESARFGSVYVSRGLAPDMGLTYWLPRIAGLSKAMELMLTGDIIDSRQALQAGIVSRVVPDDQLMSVSRELALKIAQKPPMAVEITKRITYNSINDDLNHHMAWEIDGQRQCMRSEDHREAIRALIEKRPPAPFKGW